MAVVATGQGRGEMGSKISYIEWVAQSTRMEWEAASAARRGGEAGEGTNLTESVNVGRAGGKGRRFNTCWHENPEQIQLNDTHVMNWC
jgi:hypothetical protein